MIVLLLIWIGKWRTSLRDGVGFNVRISDNLLGPEAAAGQARPTQAAAATAAELPLSVNRCRPNVVVFRLSSSSMRMRCQTKDRGWNFDDDAERGNTSDAAEISERSGGAAHMGDMT